MAVNASSLYSSVASNNSAIGGLVSGLDTDTLVEQLTQGTRSKIAKQQQNKQTLQWKQTAYRGVANTLTAFQNKYLLNNTSSTTSMRHNSFFQQWKSNIRNGDGVISFNPVNNQSTGSVSIASVQNLAKSKTYASNQMSKPLTTTFELGDISAAGWSNGTVPSTELEALFKGETLTLQLDQISSLGTSVPVTIKLDALTYATDERDFMEIFNDLLADAFGHKGSNGSYNNALTPITDPDSYMQYDNYVYAKLDAVNGTITLDAGNNQVTVARANLSFGYKVGQSNRIDANTTLKELFGDDLVGKKLLFKVNDVLIEIDDAGVRDIAYLLNKITNSAAGVTASYDAGTDRFTFTANETGAGDTLRIEDVSGNLMNLLVGAQTGSNLASNCKGLTLETTANLLPGVGTWTTGSANHGLFVDGIFQYINNTWMSGSANDWTAWSSSTFPVSINHPFSIDLTVNGVKKTITYTMTADDLSKCLPKNSSGTTLYPSDSGFDEEQFAINLANLFTANLSTAINDAFPSAGGNILIGIDGDFVPGLYIADESNLLVEISATPSIGSDNNLFSIFDFSGNTRNYVIPPTTSPDLDTIVQDIDSSFSLTPGNFTITVGSRTETFTFATTDSMESLILMINGRFGQEVAKLDNGTLVLDAGDGEAFGFQDTTGNLMEGLFGSSQLTYASQAWYKETEGENARITVYDGTTTYELFSKSNDFLVNNIAFTVDKLFNTQYPGLDPTDPLYDPTDPSNDITNWITISVGTDTDEIFNKLMEFIDDYNALMFTLNSLITEEKKADYHPLSDEQKADLSTDEIEKWEIEAKKGILRSDSTIRQIMADMRAVFYETFESVGLAAYSVGISTISMISSGSVDATKSGQLQVDEALLRAAIENNFDAVKTLFGNNSDSIAVKLDDVITRATRQSVLVENQGSLVRIAGADNQVYENSLSEKIASIDQAIARLKTRLENEYNRYWKQFTALEVALQNMSTQSGWLADMSS